MFETYAPANRNPNGSEDLFSQNLLGGAVAARDGRRCDNPDCLGLTAGLWC